MATDKCAVRLHSRRAGLRSTARFPPLSLGVSLRRGSSGGGEKVTRHEWVAVGGIVLGGA